MGTISPVTFSFILLSYNVSLLSEIYFYLLLTYWLDLNWYIYQEIWRLSIANWPTIASYGSNSFLAMIKFIIVIFFNGISWKCDTLMSIFEQRLSKMEEEYILKEGGVHFNYLHQRGGHSEKFKKRVGVWCWVRSF